MLFHPCSWMHGLSACASRSGEVRSGCVLQKSTLPAKSVPYFFSRYGRAIWEISSPQYDSLGTLIATRFAEPRCNSVIAAAVRVFTEAIDPCRTTAASMCSGTESPATSKNPPQLSKERVNTAKMPTSHTFQYDFSLGSSSSERLMNVYANVHLRPEGEGSRKQRKLQPIKVTLHVV